MADTVSKHIDMTTGSLWRNIPLFAFPVAATSILEQLSNLIATVIIGNFSDDQGTLAMAAVGSNVPLTSLMLNLFIGMSLGSNVVIANAIGRNDQNMVKRAVHTSILMALVGFVVIALGEIFAEPMLAALNVPAVSRVRRLTPARNARLSAGVGAHPHSSAVRSPGRVRSLPVASVRSDQASRPPAGLIRGVFMGASPDQSNDLRRTHACGHGGRTPPRWGGPGQRGG